MPASDVTNASAFKPGSKPDKYGYRPPIQGGESPSTYTAPPGSSAVFPFPIQPTEPVVKNQPPFYIQPDQYTPIDYNVPVGGTNLNGTKRLPSGSSKWAITNFYNQLIPTSINLRNMGLQNLLKDIQTPMEQLYASGGAGENAQTRAQSLDQLRATMASRGLSQSGINDSAQLDVDKQYLQNYYKNEGDARNKEMSRQTNLTNQLYNTVGADIDFWKYINAGRDVATGRAAGVNINALSGIGQGATNLAKLLFAPQETPPNQINNQGGDNTINFPGGGGSDLNTGGYSSNTNQSSYFDTGAFSY